ncbi:large ribosomal subunit protein mL51-like [Physella acuta]|uniref:large ribosomal subunit protein mL51-like n=1 Tax=Physella acuta TaxID=109671 RepID=UPI0027DDCD6D|nr:large ribosomal subunit protein mL51-like [Physella acuta]
MFLYKPLVKALVTSFTADSGSNYYRCFIRCSSTIKDSVNLLATYKKEKQVISADRSFEHATPSPYIKPGARRYGYRKTYMTSGVLPRPDGPLRSIPPYKVKDSWSKPKALFGQNDYIDILGDGTLHPADLLTGPRWLIAFKGNERERLMRKMEWEGPRLKMFYPTEYNRMDKRIRYLTKLYNHKRCKRWRDGPMDD